MPITAPPGPYSGPSKKLSALRNCFEAGMDFDRALERSDLVGLRPEAEAMLRSWWNSLSTKGGKS